MKYLVILLSLVLVSLSFGETVYVPDNYPTIQTAIDSVADGDTIIVRDGTYSNVILNKSIVLASEFILDARYFHILNTIIDGDLGSGEALWVQADSSEVIGFTIKGGRAISWGFEDYGAQVLCMSNNFNENISCKLRNLIVNSNHFAGVAFISTSTEMTNSIVYGLDFYTGIYLYSESERKEPKEVFHSIIMNSTVTGPIEGYQETDKSRLKITVINSIITKSVTLNAHDGEATISNSIYAPFGETLGDTVFVSLENNDYHLSDYSSAIGAGVDSILVDSTMYYAPELDIEGNPRCGPGLPDLGAYESPLTEPKVEEPNSIETLGDIPIEFNVFQNYPNPFNPNTTIEFSIPNTDNVKLVVYDIQGRVVEVLVNGRLNVGSYSVDFDGSELASGTYFYVLSTSSNRSIKRMNLVK